MPINEKAGVLNDVLVYLMRHDNRGALHSQNFELNQDYNLHSISMTVAEAKSEIYKMLLGDATIDEKSLRYVPILSKAKITRVDADLILNADYLATINALTGPLKFDIDAAITLAASLTDEEKASLKNIPAIAEQFEKLFRHLFTGYGFEDTAKKILALVSKYNSDLKPWHVEKLFISRVLQHNMMAWESSQIAQLEDSRGVNQCWRNERKLKEVVYPRVTEVLEHGLLYSNEEAQKIALSISQYSVVNFEAHYTDGMRSLITFCILQAKEKHTTAERMHVDVLRVLDLKSYPSSYLADNHYINQVKHLPINKEFVSFISPDLYVAMDNIVKQLSSDPKADVNKLINDLYQGYYYISIAKFNDAIRDYVTNKVVPVKFELLNQVQIYNILSPNNAEAAALIQQIERSIALDLINCGTDYYDFDHATREYKLLVRYKGDRPEIKSLPTTIDKPQGMDDSVATEDLTPGNGPRSTLSFFENAFATYSNKMQKLQSEFRQSQVTSSQRRLLQLAEDKPKAMEAEGGDMISNFIYHYVGKPLLDALNSSPTYFPPGQAIWSENGNGNKHTLFRPAKTEPYPQVVPSITYTKTLGN